MEVRPLPEAAPEPDAGRLAWLVDRDDPVTTVVLHGRLDSDGVPALRTGLLSCLAECPAAVVVDVSTVRVDDDPAVLVFPSVVGEGDGFPPVPLLLCGADHDLTARLVRLRIHRYARLFPTREAARAAATAPAALAGRVVAPLAADASAPAEARDLTERACRAWRLRDLVVPAQLLVSELCTNAILHGRPPVRLVLTLTGTHLHVVVRDGEPRLPVVRRRPPDGDLMASGNGLHLVTAVAAAWGAQPTVDGKAVWAAIRRRRLRQRLVPTGRAG
jgi:anti-sigma regulatory factor (Ser/Thr protein kinase)